MEFWLRCLKAGCVVVPLRVYSRYNAAGNTSEGDFVGLKFVALPFDGEAVGPDFYFGIEHHMSGDYPMFDTPEEALAEYESR